MGVWLGEPKMGVPRGPPGPRGAPGRPPRNPEIRKFPGGGGGGGGPGGPPGGAPKRGVLGGLRGVDLGPQKGVFWEGISGCIKNKYI